MNDLVIDLALEHDRHRRAHDRSLALTCGALVGVCGLLLASLFVVFA